VQLADLLDTLQLLRERFHLGHAHLAFSATPLAATNGRAAWFVLVV
jgi:hypothetical protein